MLAWQKHLGNLKAVRQEVSIPSCPQNGFLVKVLAAGVCHVSSPVHLKSATIGCGLPHQAPEQIKVQSSGRTCTVILTTAT